MQLIISKSLEDYPNQISLIDIRQDNITYNRQKNNIGTPKMRNNFKAVKFVFGIGFVH